MKELVHAYWQNVCSKSNLPPTVAPIRATNSSKGILKKEFSASHVSAKASGGVDNIKELVKRNATAKNLSFWFPCQTKDCYSG